MVLNWLILFLNFGILICQQSFPNQGNEFTDMGASDISFIVIEVPHPRFKREGDNLRTTVEISLQEVIIKNKESYFNSPKQALLGFEKTLEHLDGHKVTLKRDFVTQPGDVEKIKGQGMPQHTYSSYYGVNHLEDFKLTLFQRIYLSNIK